ncbi:MAG: Spx/MgsR family RNA polymerase-binding regulatory protein [Chitinophagaceae bacterium]|nr:Spx/MgsR family RNA polymerase-binding regulatory protein [Bacteroidota bacterium]MCC6258355.1 Spx/MgsR family RNA polymerase-binding regulatory protein [Chitinophagaceae bacterium]MCW5917471.1 Spx/MgsR family RNA polymerase-binding regulatory protein [Ferruginibacter sp.]
MMDVYGLPNCDSTKKLLKRLKRESVYFRFINLKENPPEISTIEAWIKELGIDQILNRQSTTWRGLEEAEKEEAGTSLSAAGLMCRYPTLIKRPLISNEKSYFTGLKEPGISAFLNQ